MKIFSYYKTVIKDYEFIYEDNDIHKWSQTVLLEILWLNQDMVFPITQACQQIRTCCLLSMHPYAYSKHNCQIDIDSRSSCGQHRLHVVRLGANWLLPYCVLTCNSHELNKNTYYYDIKEYIIAYFNVDGEDPKGKGI